MAARPVLLLKEKYPHISLGAVLSAAYDKRVELWNERQRELYSYAVNNTDWVETVRNDYLIATKM